jgi:endonuclease YncB( thermonuclease family)
MKRKAAFPLLLVAIVLLWAFSDRLFPGPLVAGEAARAIDGDSLRIDKTVVRLADIDAPEFSQPCKDRLGFDWPCGRAARHRLAELIAAGGVECRQTGEDRYRRIVARCASRSAPDLGAAMVESGHAIGTRARGSGRYEFEQASARSARRGIWAGRFTTPAEWRHANSGKDD